MGVNLVEGGGGTSIPQVLSSEVQLGTQADGILVTWDQEMMNTCDPSAQINVIIDGAAPVHPVHVVFHPHDRFQMAIVMSKPFVAGQVVTWAYDDSGHCDIQTIDTPHKEIENQTYGVTITSVVVVGQVVNGQADVINNHKTVVNT